MQAESGVRLFSGAVPTDAVCVHVHECTPVEPVGRSVEALGRLSRAKPDPAKAGKVQSSVLLCSYCEDLLCLLGELFCCAFWDFRAPCMHAAAPRVT